MGYHKLITQHYKNILKLYDLYFKGKLTVKQNDFIYNHEITLKLNEHSLGNFGRKFKLTKEQNNFIFNIVNYFNFFILLYFDVLEKKIVNFTA